MAFLIPSLVSKSRPLECFLDLDSWEFQAYLHLYTTQSRHGIRHGRTDIVRVKCYLPGVKLSSDLTLLVFNLLVVVNTF